MGLSDGNVLGDRVDTEGETLGDAEGAEDGLLDGDVVGCNVGTDGLAVGLGVGCPMYEISASVRA